MHCRCISILFAALSCANDSGFGSTIIKAPHLLSLRLSPGDASATMQIMLAVATAASMAQYASLHILPTFETLSLFAVHAFIASFIGLCALALHRFTIFDDLSL
jgi:hypothetical protein